MPRAAKPATVPPIAPRHVALLTVALALLIAVRVLVEFRSGAWCWGLDYGRYLSPRWRWGPWLAALVFVIAATLPPVRAAIARGVRGFATRPAPIVAIVALACGALCFAFPDLTHFTGDFALRRSAIVGITDFDRLFPQASALDRFLHLVLPRTVIASTGLHAGTIASTQGAVNAALFGALAVAFARHVAAQPLAALVAAATVIGSAALGLFTGYDKSLAELSVVTLAFAVAGLGELSGGRPAWTSGLMVALAIALHRSGLALMPAWLLLWAWVPAPPAARGRRVWPWSRLVPAALMAAQLPVVWKVAHAVDARHLAPTGVGHLLTAAFEPARLVALANLALFLVPLLPLLPVVFAIARRERQRSAVWLGWLGASWLLPMLAIHPVQGEFRDWDDFAAAAVAMALPLALLLARACARAPAALATTVIAAALVPRVQWLALEARPQRALERVEAWAAGPPAPARTVAAATLEFVAVSHFRDRRLEDGRRTMAAAIAQMPWERLYLGAANAEAQAGDWSYAVTLYEEAARRFPNDATPWMMLAQAAFQHGDRDAASRAVAELRRMAPADPWTARAEAALRQMTPAAP